MILISYGLKAASKQNVGKNASRNLICFYLLNLNKNLSRSTLNLILSGLIK